MCSRWSWLVSTTVFLLLGSGAVDGRRTAWAQSSTVPDTAENVPGRKDFQEGRRAFENGRLERAARLLQRSFDSQPLYTSSKGESIAYWLGRAQMARGDTVAALLSWKEGLRTFEKVRLINPHLAEACLQQLFSMGKEEAGALAYRHLISGLGTEIWMDSLWQQTRPRIVRLGFILPEQTRHKIVGEGNEWDEALQTGIFAPGAGRMLLAWWRSQDPLPSTRRNERLFTHLKRSSHAVAHYAEANSPSGLDDRGEVYIRFGEPPLRHSISFDDIDFIREVLRPGVGVTRNEFPENEIWSYPDIDPLGKYIFVRTQNGRYRRGGTLDLLAPELRRSFGGANREQDLAYSSVAALRYIYEELSLYYSNYGNLYGEVTSYMMRQRAMSNAARMSRESGMSLGMNETTIGMGSGDRRVYADPSLGRVAPNAFATQIVTKNRHLSQQFIRRRDLTMPLQYSAMSEYTSAEPLPVHVRTARFLSEDGTTKTEIYWSATLEALKLSDRKRKSFSKAEYASAPYHFLNFSVIESTGDHRRRLVHRRRYFIDRRETQGVIQPQIYTTKGGIGSRFNLGLQWDQHLAYSRRDDSTQDVEVGPQTQIAIHRFDSLSALSTDSRKLVMSDLKPMTAPPGSTQPQEIIETARPYPFEEVAADASLLLYFEVYHLALGPKDRTRYSVEYELQRRTKKQGAFNSLFGRDEKQNVSTKSTYEGRSHQSDEYILLDLNKVNPDEESTIGVVVRVTDELTGQTRERAISFGVQPDGNR